MFILSGDAVLFAISVAFIRPIIQGVDFLTSISLNEGMFLTCFLSNRWHMRQNTEPQAIAYKNLLAGYWRSELELKVE